MSQPVASGLMIAGAILVGALFLLPPLQPVIGGIFLVAILGAGAYELWHRRKQP